MGIRNVFQTDIIGDVSWNRCHVSRYVREQKKFPQNLALSQNTMKNIREVTEFELDNPIISFVGKIGNHLR